MNNKKTVVFSGISNLAYKADGLFVVKAQDENNNPLTITIKQAGGLNREYASKEAAIFKSAEENRNEDGTLDAEFYVPLAAKLYAETILVDWSGFKDENGVEIPFSPEVAEQMLIQFERIFNHIVDCSREDANFAASGNGAAVKN